VLTQSLEDYLSLMARERGEAEGHFLEYLKSSEKSSSPHVDQRLPPKELTMNHLLHAPRPPPHPRHSQAPFLSPLCQINPVTALYLV